MATKRKRPAAAPSPKSKRPRTLDSKLAEEDARIADLERKLGIKKGRKSAPKSFQDDGLEELFGVDVAEPDDPGNQQRIEYHDWLAEKRGAVVTHEPSESDDVDTFEGFSDDALSAQGSHVGASETETESDGLESMTDIPDDEDAPRSEPEKKKAKQRENPYVAPVADVAGTRYVPPAKRLAAGSGDNARLRIQFQGLLNKLSEDNIRGIVKDVERAYSQNARGEVTAALVDAILAQVSKPETLPDTFFVRTAGFVAALYRIVGESFASHAVTRTVEMVLDEYAQVRETADPDEDGQALAKTAPNLITFVSQLYVFQVVGCKLIFDLMRLFLDDLSEINTMLLLRIVRTAGKLLRKDDRKALGQVAEGLQALVRHSKARVSERTKVMIDLITDLKNNKLRKTSLQESDVVAQSVTTMRKILGSLQESRNAGRPLPVGLKDIELAGTRGKWWLVGASFAGRDTSLQSRSEEKAGDDEEAGDEVDGGMDVENDPWLDILCPDYAKVAREQGLKTGSEVAIFEAIVGARNATDAFLRFRKLGLNKHHKLDVAFVLLQAVGGYHPYSAFYAHVAEKVCQDGKIKFAFQDRLWQVFRRLGEPLFGEGGDEDEDEDGHDNTALDDDRLSNMGRFLGYLIARSILSVRILKCLELTRLKRKTSLLVKHMMVTVIRDCVKLAKGDKKARDTRVERTFSPAASSPLLTAGLSHVLLKKVGKEAAKCAWVKKGYLAEMHDACEYAEEVLRRELASGAASL